jgi:uncharacterized membrane protein
MTGGLFVLAVLCVIVLVSEILARRTFLRHVGSALLVILVTAVAANLGLIPTSSEQAPIYDGIFSYVAPMAVFLLLLTVNLKHVLKAGVPMILIYLTGAAGTIVGAVVGMGIIDGRDSIGELYRAIGGMYTGTYIGGSVNFNAIALHYGVMKNGTLFAAAVAVDNIITTIWMLICLALPKFLKRSGKEPVEATMMIEEETEATDVFHWAILLSTGLFSLWLSDLLASWFHLPSILILSTIALLLAQFPFVQHWKGARSLGMFGLLLFLATIGAFCDLSALRQIGQLGGSLLLFALLIVTIHGIITFVAAFFLKIDPIVSAVASQANIGGPASALAVARSLGRSDLLLPGILVGMLGYGIGNYAGFWVAEFLL